jgi:glycosyltransferase involved in cell wall biosynthesis
LEALVELKKLHPNILFYWLGTNELDLETSAKIESYNLGETFFYLSNLQIGTTRTDLLNLVNCADLFVMPSLEEGLPIGLIEAMALQKASIASRINAIPEAIEHMVNGVLIEPGDSGQIIEAIETLMLDSTLRLSLAKKAQETAFAKFDERKSGGNMLEYYESVG